MLKLFELKAETYNGMIRSLKPGYRSIIVLVDDESKEQLLKEFRKSVWPYRKNKSLLFGYLSLEKNLDWYKDLLEQVLGFEGLKLNMKNCSGTVLSLNGFKKYVRIFHVKHQENNSYKDDDTYLDSEDEDEAEIYRSDDVELGADSENCAITDLCSGEHLLDSLPFWLERLFDGLTKRYFVDCWPENLK